MKNVKRGDRIHCNGITVEIGKVVYQDYYAGTWDIEFFDTQGNYRHWKQALDGGHLVRQKKKLVNWYGVDVTDLFLKYNMPV